MRVILREEGIEYKPGAMKIDSAEDVYKAAGEIVNSATEVIAVLCLTARNELIAAEICNSGTINNAPVYVREVFRAAIIRNASAIILLHVHPSGYPKPSTADINITEIIVNAGKLLDVQVYDHIILAPPDKYYSIKREGKCKF